MPIMVKHSYNALHASDSARVMSVAYENLHVFGYGSDTDFQNIGIASLRRQLQEIIDRNRNFVGKEMAQSFQLSLLYLHVG
jgi:hypothetical protein